jgi:hypothetical protein
MGISLDALAALLGHTALAMTNGQARMPDNTMINNSRMLSVVWEGTSHPRRMGAEELPNGSWPADAAVGSYEWRGRCPGWSTNLSPVPTADRN